MNKSKNLGRGLLALFLCSMITLAGFVNMDRVVADDGERIDQYTTRITDKNGNVVYREVVPGSPPPAVLPDAVGVPMANTGAGTNTLTNVPTSTWAYGCSATAEPQVASFDFLGACFGTAHSAAKRSNDQDHRPGVTDVRSGTRALSPGSVHPFCSAFS